MSSSRVRRPHVTNARQSWGYFFSSWQRNLTLGESFPEETLSTNVAGGLCLSYFEKNPQINPPINPSPKIGPYCFVTRASGKLNIVPTSAPFTQPGMGKSRLKMINPIANRLMKEAVIALVLLSNVMKSMGMIEATPKIVPAMRPLVMFDIGLFFSSDVSHNQFNNLVNLFLKRRGLI